MATFRSILYRWMFAGAIFCGGFASLGAVFAPPSSLFEGFSGSMCLGPSMEFGTVSSPVETKLPSRRDMVLGRLEELVFTHHAIATSV